MYECPVDDTHTNIFLVNLRNIFLDPSEDKRMNDRNWQVVSQDIKVLTDLRAEGNSGVQYQGVYAAGGSADSSIPREVGGI